jgi:DNA-directed RNA polymerase subunit RPC12/RpoP
MQLEFECLTCGSPGVEFPTILKDDAPIKCQRCKAVICSLGEFRRRVYWQPSRVGGAEASCDDPD